MFCRSSSRLVLPVLLLAVLAGPARSQPPNCSISGPSFGCGSADLCGPVGNFGYEWFGLDGAVMGNSRCVSATSTGMYWLIVTDNVTGWRSERCGWPIEIQPAPAAEISGPLRVCDGESATLCGPAGDLTWSWSGPGGFAANTQCVSVGVGGTYTLDVGSAGGCVSRAQHSLVVERCVTNQAPDASNARASVQMLWPPNKEFQAVSVVGITDPDGDPVSVEITSVRQNEVVGARCPDARLVPGGVELRRERSHARNGRVYEICFTASDGQASCAGRVRVWVPEDRSGGRSSDVALVDSMGPCSEDFSCDDDDCGSGHRGPHRHHRHGGRR